MKGFLGALAGIVVGILVQSGLGYVSAMAFPQPAVNMWNQQQVAEMFAARPLGALLLYVVSYLVAAAAGAWLARIIARSGWVAWVPAGVLAAMALIVAVTYPEPAWAQFGAFAAALLGGLIGRHLPAGRSAPEAAAPEAEDAGR